MLSRILEPGRSRELAEFWDTHDLTDFTDHLEEVKEPVFARQGPSVIRVSVTEAERRTIQQMAASRGIQEAALIREWVREKLQKR